MSTEQTTPATEIKVSANGPYLIKGNLKLILPDGSVKEESSLHLCRCGKSKNAPFCDGSHAK